MILMKLFRWCGFMMLSEFEEVSNWVVFQGCGSKNTHNLSVKATIAHGVILMMCRHILEYPDMLLSGMRLLENWQHHPHWSYF